MRRMMCGVKSHECCEGGVIAAECDPEGEFGSNDTAGSRSWERHVSLVGRLRGEVVVSEWEKRQLVE
jgi:hypothetical protein